MMRRGTGFHADEARCQVFEECHHLTAAKLLSDDDFLGRVDAVNLEYVLGEIQTDRGNLHVDVLLHVIRLTTITLWHLDAGSRRRPPHQTLPSAHSITSSASASRVGGISRPSVFAVLRLMTSSNFVGSSTGKSDGFAPLNILST